MLPAGLLQQLLQIASVTALEQRLRQLLACGAAVLHVPHASEEWFTPLLRDGTHYLRLRGGTQSR